MNAHVMLVHPQLASKPSYGEFGDEGPVAYFMWQGRHIAPAQNSIRIRGNYRVSGVRLPKYKQLKKFELTQKIVESVVGSILTWDVMS